MGQIITIPGVRRSGKSSKMKLVINELVKTGVPPQNILWMGFDDERLAEMSRQELNEISCLHDVSHSLLFVCHLF